MFGYTAEELQTRFHNNFAGMIYEKDLRGVWETALRQLAKSNTKEIEYRVRCKDGRLVWVLDRGQLVEGRSAAGNGFTASSSTSPAPRRRRRSCA